MKDNILKISVILILGIFFLFFGIDVLNSFYPQADAMLDSSWVWALNHINVNPQFIFGRDVFFTFGPLGYLFYPMCEGINFQVGVVLKLLFGLTFFSVLIFYLKQRKPYSCVKMLLWFPFWFLSIILYGNIGYEWAWILLFLMILFEYWYLKKENKVAVNVLPILAGLISVFCVLSKFTLLACSMVVITIFLVLLYFYKNSYFKKFMINYFSTFLSLILIAIIFLFHGFGNFANWLVVSYEISRGYNESMVSYCVQICLIYACLILFLFIGLVASIKNDNKKEFIISLILIPVAFVLFKYGIVRSADHLPAFFETIIYLFGILFLYSSKGVSRKVFLAIILVFLLSWSSATSYKNFNTLFLKNVAIKVIKLEKTIKNLSSQKMEQKSLEKVHLPKDWRDEIGDNSVEVLSWNLVYILENNFKNLYFTPTLQLYSTYTPKLDKLAAEEIKKDLPMFLLVDFNTIDNRNLLLDTPELWNVVFDNYEVDKKSKELLLLKKKKEFKGSEFSTLLSEDYLKNQEISILTPYASIEFEKSLQGKVVSTLLRGCNPVMTINYLDGTSIRHKILVENASEVVRIEQVPKTLEEFAQNITSPKKTVKNIAFSECDMHYNDKIHIEWKDKI